MLVSTLSADGQVMIPKELRQRLDLKAGDRLAFLMDARGDLIVRPEARQPLGRVPGLLRHLAPARPVSVEEMNEAIREAAVERYRRATDDRT